METEAIKLGEDLTNLIGNYYEHNDNIYFEYDNEIVECPLYCDDTVCLDEIVPIESQIDIYSDSEMKRITKEVRNSKTK